MIPIFEKAHQLDLTGTEEEILQYFESNLPASIYTSLNDLSASLYTSNATIVRFCQKLGLKGYNEFKYQVRGELKQLHMTPTSDDLMHHTLAGGDCRPAHQRAAHLYIRLQPELTGCQISSDSPYLPGLPLYPH